MTKLLFFDLETTGVNHRRNGIHQISGLIDIDGIIKEEFDFRVRPNPQAVIEDEALKIAGVTREQIDSYPSMREVYNQFIDVLARYVSKFDRKDKFHLVGYNNRGFDDPFLRAWFEQNFDKYFGSWFWADSLDCLVLASYALRNERRKLENFQLRTVAKHLGITVDETKLHDARYDIGLTRDIFYKLPQYGQESNRQDRIAA
jgi:DNA polymerase III subunit epsilon